MVKKRGDFKAFLAAVERIINRLTTPVMILLALLILAEFTLNIERYKLWFDIVDYCIIGFFVTDLLFKYFHTKTLLKFVKLYWLEIIAVFPFYLIFRVFVDIGAFGETLSEAQKITHEASLARETELLGKEAKVLRDTRLLREAQVVGEEASIFSRIARFFQDIYRIIVSRLGLAHKAMVHDSYVHRHKRKSSCQHPD